MTAPLHRNPLGLVVCAAAAAAFIVLVGWFLLDLGSTQCPADLGLRPSTGLDGRTVCVSVRQ